MFGREEWQAVVLCGCDKCLLTHSFDRRATLRSRALGEAQSLRMGVSCAWGPPVFQSGREETKLTSHLEICMVEDMVEGRRGN